MTLLKKILRYPTGTVFVVGALLFIITAVITYPIITGFSTILPGVGDVYTYLWGLWWFMYAIVHLHMLPFVTDMQFYPQHINISQDLSVVHGLLSLPIAYVWGPVAAYNFVLFFTFIITGVGFYIFLKSIVRNNYAAFFGTFIFTFSYGRLYRALVGQLDIASTEWMGFILYFLFQLFIRRKYTQNNVFGAALFLGLTAYTEYRNLFYMILFTAVFIPLSAVIHFWQDDHNDRKINFLKMLGSSITLVLATNAFIFPLLLVNLHKIGDVQYAPTYPPFNANALSFFLLPCDVLLSRIIGWCYWPAIFEGRLVYFGMIPVLLTLLYVTRRVAVLEKRVVYIYSGCLIVFTVFSLGTQTLFYQIFFNNVLLFKVMRVSSRLTVLAEISLALFSALGLEYIAHRLKHKPWRWVIYLIIVAVATLEIWPFNMKYTDVRKIPEKHLSVIKNDIGISMLEIPFGFRGNIYESFGSHETEMSFYYQMKHHVPIIGGYMSMLDWAAWVNIKQDTLLQKLIDCQTHKRCEPMTEDEKSRFIMVYKVRYVTFLNRKYSHMEKYLLDMFALTKLYDDGSVTVWGKIADM